MKTPLTLRFHQVSFSKGLKDIIHLSCLRLCLFFVTTTFRHFGSSIVIALLLFVMSASGEPLDLNHLDLHIASMLILRVVSMMLSIGWMGIGLGRLIMQVTRANTWRQEMRHNEEYLHQRISILEDWLVLPTYKINSEATRVRCR